MELTFIEKTKLPSSKKFFRLSTIGDKFWLPVPEWHCILVICPKTGNVTHEIKHRYLQQPYVVKDVFDNQQIVIGAMSGIYTLDLPNFEKCKIISDAKTMDLDATKTNLIAYDIRRKALLIFRKTGAEWTQVKVIKPAKDKEVDRILIGNEDQIIIHYCRGGLSQYTKSGLLISNIELEYDTRSPTNGSKLCFTDSNRSVALLNWFKNTIDFYKDCLSKRHSSIKQTSDIDDETTKEVKTKEEIKLQDVSNANDMVVKGDILYVLGGLYVFKFSLTGLS